MEFLHTTPCAVWYVLGYCVPSESFVEFDYNVRRVAVYSYNASPKVHRWYIVFNPLLFD